MSTINSFIREFVANLSNDIDENAKQEIINLWESSDIQQKLSAVCDSSKEHIQNTSVKVPKPKNAYVLYCQDYRSEAKRQLPTDHKNSDVMSKLGQMWKFLSSSTKEEDMELVSKYKNQATANKEIYMNDQNIVAKPTKNTQGSKETKPTKQPKRAKNAYVLYSLDHRSSVKSELGSAVTNADVIRELGKRWKMLSTSLDTQDQELVLKYTTQAASEKEKFAAKKSNPGNTHILETKYCHGCYNQGRGYNDEQGWFYCNQCWDWYNGSSENKEIEPKNEISSTEQNNVQSNTVLREECATSLTHEQSKETGSKKEINIDSVENGGLSNPDDLGEEFGETQSISDKTSTVDDNEDFY